MEVTFLMTEVADAAASWEHDPEVMAAALAGHNTIVRRELEAAGAEIVAAGGDGFSAVFDTPTEAAVAALGVRSSLAGRSEPIDLGARVRIGIHTGDAFVSGGALAGPALSRAGRLTAAAHPGQTLVSTATADLLQKSALAGGHLVDLGMHRLQDMALGERVHELVHSGSDGGFPPLDSAERPGNLPVQPDRLIGRDELVAEVAALAGRHRLITLVGPGGVGKTRLAVATASELAHRGSDGAWLCELGRSEDDDDADDALLAAIGLRPLPALAATEVVIRSLTRMTAVLVLDTCEHLLPWTARTVESLIGGCPDLTVIAATRESIGASGERIVPVAHSTTGPRSPCSRSELAASEPDSTPHSPTRPR